MATALRTLLRLLGSHGPPRVLGAALGAASDAAKQRRLHIAASGREPVSWRILWRWPTRPAFVAALRRRLGLTQLDFRRRAESATDIDRLPPDTSAVSTVLLAGAQALTASRTQSFLQSQAAAGTLRIVHPNDPVQTRPGTTTLLYGIEADAAGHARLLDLRHRGIACDWLAGTAQDTVPEEVPLREACLRDAFPTADIRSLAYMPIVAQAPLTNRHCHVLRCPLRILSYRWHVPHQYELFKLGAKFVLVTDLGESTCRWWDLGQRPLPANASLVRWSEIDPQDFDLAILHFDENVLQAADDAPSIGIAWGQAFRFLHERLAIPRIAICHGTPQEGDDARRVALVDFLGDTPVVVNSHQALAEWRFRNARVIWQGFDPAEFPGRPPRGLAQPRILTLPGEATAERPGYRGADLLGQVAERVATPLEPLRVAEPNLLLSGNAYASARFVHYVAALHSFDIYFNPTLRSPMPRSRGEAMLCGLATVNADSHDIDHFIHSGVNGFYASTVDELAEQLRFLAADPARAWRIGLAGRDTAVKCFHIDRYLADWRQLIREVLGSDAI